MIVNGIYILDDVTNQSVCDTYIYIFFFFFYIYRHIYVYIHTIRTYIHVCVKFSSL